MQPTTRPSTAFAMLFVFGFGWLTTPFVAAQAGLREALDRLDRNQDGQIEPEEITPLARPYLERISKARRMSLNRTNDISDFQEAARIYHALQNGISGREVRSEPNMELRGFRPDDDDVLIPEFGLSEVKYPYTQDDLDEARRTIRRYDRDDDGYIDRREAARAEWTHRNPFESDLNKDNRLSKLELTQRYARRRLLDSVSGELIQKAVRVGNGIEDSKRSDSSRESSSWWRRGGSSYWLTASLLGRFDENRNGRLEAGEAQALGISMGAIDLDRDGELSRDELQSYTTSLQNDAGDPGAGLPGWFFELDKDRDGQVAMPEFATEWTATKLAEFNALDRNSDGLLTESEVLSAKSMVGGRFANTNAEILPPKKTVISEIEIQEDLLIDDLNVELSITHSSVGMLDGYLTGPNGQRVELFTDVGSDGDHFENTVFDDQASTPIVKARAPFEGSYTPEAIVKREPGLSQFNGQSAQGVWQLVIRATRSDRFGMLHRWSLQIRAADAAISDQLLGSLNPEADSSSFSEQPAARAAEPMENSSPSSSTDAWFSQAMAEDDAKRDRKSASEAWIQAAGPEEAEKRREQMERYNAWVRERKEQGQDITAEDKRRFFPESGPKLKGNKDYPETKRKDEDKLRKK
ncbi:MAG: proprotein convertase P-domain-containing protein [bacterium]|nr:proprotein convertase P-domain-containing protein [bacterium]